MGAKKVANGFGQAHPGQWIGLDRLRMILPNPSLILLPSVLSVSSCSGCPRIWNRCPSVSIFLPRRRLLAKAGG